MNPIPLKDDELADSTDWLPTPLPKLSGLDSALRCQVCKDFYKTPVITSCSHTFCSICIRRCLSTDGKCPLCRTSDQETKLRKNDAIEDAVEAFTAARQQIMDYVKRPVSRGESSDKRKRGQLDGEAGHESKRTRGTPRRNTRAVAQETVVVPDSDEDGDYEPDDEVGPDGLANCPICNGRMTVLAIQTHIDKCDGVPPKPPKRAFTTQQSIASPPAGISKPFKRPETLPNPHYASIKDNALRKKLMDNGLSAAGTRPSMEKRWSEFVIAHNANCDAKNPKTKQELQRYMDSWEKNQGGKQGPMSLAQREGAQIKEKDFDGIAWGAKHEDSFKDLIANARKRVPKKTQGNPTASLEIGNDSRQQPASSENPYTTPYQAPVDMAPLSTSNVYPSYSVPQYSTRSAAAAPMSLRNICNSPEKQRSQPTFFEETNIPSSYGDHNLPPSQLQTPKTNDNTEYGSDISTIRPVQP